MKSQKQQILELLKEGHQLSKLQILEKLGCWNSGARIEELRRKGEPIRTRMVKNELSGKYFAVYYM